MFPCTCFISFTSHNIASCYCIIACTCRLNGGELFDYVVEREFLEESQAVNYLTQILEAMAFCHERNIVHLDLKVPSMCKAS